MASPRQPFTPCKLYIDGADGLSAGDYIVTSGGSAYLVQATRPSPLHKGQHRQGVAAVATDQAFASDLTSTFQGHGLRCSCVRNANVGLLESAEPRPPECQLGRWHLIRLPTGKPFFSF